MRAQNRRGVLQGLLAAALFGAATPISKRLLVDVSPQVLAGLFYAGAAAALLPITVRSTPHGDWLGLPRDSANRLEDRHSKGMRPRSQKPMADCIGTGVRLPPAPFFIALSLRGSR